MDLAGTPALPQQSATLDRLRDRAASVRLVPAQEAEDATFLVNWQRLARNAAEPNPFFEAWFLLPSLKSLAGDDEPVLFTTWHKHRLTGMLPLALPRSYYGHRVPHVSSWLHDNAFCGAPLVEEGHEHQFWRSLLAQLDYEPGRAIFLHCPELPKDGPLNAALCKVLAETDRSGATIDSAERAMLASDLGPDEYLAAAMSAKKRKELRRQRTRLAEEGDLQFERAEGEEGIDQWIAEFLSLEARGWKGKAGSALSCAASTSTFFTHALFGAAKAGRLERLALRLDGKPIAMLANFITAPGAFSFKTTFDEEYARFSPGLLLQIENLALLNRDEIEWTDSCAVEGHSMIERIWRGRRAVVSRNIAIGGPIRRAAFRMLAAYETRGSKAE